MKGTYTLLLENIAPVEIQIGELGKIEFEKGGYAYVGSALNGLESRIERHLSDEKKLHWHIDYLLKRAQIKEVLYAEGEQKKECDIAENLANSFTSIEGFGSSDCDCESHLFYSKDTQRLSEGIELSFKEEGLKPEVW